MIMGFLTRWMEEAAVVVPHKAWGDEELSINEQTRKEKTAQKGNLHATVGGLGTAIAKRTEELEKLAAAIAELSANRAEGTRHTETFTLLATKAGRTVAHSGFTTVPSLLYLTSLPPVPKTVGRLGGRG